MKVKHNIQVQVDSSIAFIFRYCKISKLSSACKSATSKLILIVTVTFSVYNKRKICAKQNGNVSRMPMLALGCYWSGKWRGRREIWTERRRRRIGDSPRNRSHIRTSWTTKFTRTRPLLPTSCSLTRARDENVFYTNYCCCFVSL